MKSVIVSDVQCCCLPYIRSLTTSSYSKSSDINIYMIEVWWDL